MRLRVRGEQIVEADADGLSEDLAGLTLLEAAAVDGEELAVEALAAAIGPAFRAAPLDSRVAVAMSGGVDSAVALLRAGTRRDRRHAAALGRSRGARTPSAPAARPTPFARHGERAMASVFRT